MKKIKANKNKAGKKFPLVGGAAKSLKKLSKSSSKGISRLSTTQKVLAVTTLGALGISYLANRMKKSRGSAPVFPLAQDASAAEEKLHALGE